jgi:serine/threonine protein kinase
MNRREYIHSRKKIRNSKKGKRKRTIKNTKKITKNAKRTINKIKYKKRVLKKYSGGYAKNIIVTKKGSIYNIKGSFNGKKITNDLNLPLRVPISIDIDKNLQDFYNFRNDISFDKSYSLPSRWFFKINASKEIKNFLVRVNNFMYQEYVKLLTNHDISDISDSFCKNYQIYRDFLLGNEYSKYEEVKELGRGNSGSVHLVELDGTKYVCKKALPDKDIKKLYLDQFSEVQTMRCLLGSHFNVQFKEYITFGPHGYNNYLIFEHGECSLSDVINKQTNFSLKKDSTILFAQIAMGIREMHSLGFYHRDLKVANIIVTSRGNVKITDYGCTTNMTSMTSSKKYIGTTNSMPIPIAIQFLYLHLKLDIYHLPNIPDKYWKLNFYDWWGYINIVWQIEKYLSDDISQGGIFNDAYINITKGPDNTKLLPTFKKVLKSNKNIIENSNILTHLLNYNSDTWDNILGDTQLNYNKMDIDIIEKRCTLLFDYFRFPDGFESLETWEESALDVSDNQVDVSMELDTPTSTTTQDVSDNQVDVSMELGGPQLARGGSPYENSELIGRECNDLKQRDNMYRYPNIPIFEKNESEYTSEHFNFTFNEYEYSRWVSNINFILKRFTMYKGFEYPLFKKQIRKRRGKFGVDVKPDPYNYPTIFKSSDNQIKPGMFVYGYKISKNKRVISLKGKQSLPESASDIIIRAFMPENILLHNR